MKYRCNFFVLLPLAFVYVILTCLIAHEVHRRNSIVHIVQPMERVTLSPKELESQKVFYNDTSLAIAIIVVLEDNNNKEIYQHAIASVECYARAQDYRFSLLIASDYSTVCPHRDKFFRRHCVVAHVLNESDYSLFIDADMGVVNPMRRIEEYIVPGKEIIFYDRFYNFEIMAGSYLARNSEWTRMFLMGWANYEFRLPNSVHGTDNGAIHAFILEVLFPERSHEHDLCMKIYNNSVNVASLFAFEACVRSLMGRGEDFGRIRILGKGGKVVINCAIRFLQGKGWARDNWLTNSKWSPARDFIIHSWKLNQLLPYREVELPITNTTWNYDVNLIASEEEISKKLNRFYAEVEIDRIRAYVKMAQLLEIK